MIQFVLNALLAVASGVRKNLAGGVLNAVRPYKWLVLGGGVLLILAWAVIAQWRVNSLQTDIAQQKSQIEALSGQLKTLEANTAKLLSVLAAERRAVAKSQKYRKRIEESVNAVKNHDRPVGPVLQHLVDQLRRIDAETRGGSSTARIPD